LTGNETFKHSNHQSANYLYRDRSQTAHTVMANIAPYRLATGTTSLLTTGTINRMASPVTQTPSTAVPLCASWKTHLMMRTITENQNLIHNL
jgi:hypothetical protein